MKKMILSITALVLLTMPAVYAQDAATSNKVNYWSVGPVAGFGHNWLMNMNNQNFKPSGEFGISVIYSKVEHWGIGVDLTASAEGYATEYSTVVNNYSTEVTPLYLRFTPKAYYFFGDFGDIIRPKVYLGPSIAYKLSESQNVSYTSYTNGDSPSPMVSPQGELFNDIDFGVKAGVGANVRIAKRTWFNFDGGYYQGLIDATDMNHLNSNVRLNLGVMFGL